MERITREELHEISERRGQQDLIDLLPRVSELLDELTETHQALRKERAAHRRTRTAAAAKAKELEAAPAPAPAPAKKRRRLISKK